ncbi:MAG: TIGR00341 family protein [Saprospiraceae bacterium]|nr:TIGR00341 family protein [Saprospiraceae bacterium]
MQFVEIISSGPVNEELKNYIDDLECYHKIAHSGKGGAASVRLVVSDEELSSTLEELEKRLKEEKVVVYELNAVIPEDEEKDEEEELKIGRFFKTSREELRDVIESPVNLSINFFIMIIMSSIVAGIGILQQNVAIVIGAMVIAPFLGPNMLISFGITLGSTKLIYRGLYVGAIATAIAVIISVLWGVGSDQIHDVPRDYVVSYQDIALAMACGFAGALSVMSRQGVALVGVMVAAALLPPLISAGLFLGGGYYGASFNKVILFGINIVCLILSGVIMFYISGITPNTWWQKEQARKRTVNAVIVLGLLLSILAVLVWLMGRN